MNYEEALNYFYNLKEKTTPFFNVENHDLLTYLLSAIFINLIMIAFSTLMVSIDYEDQQIKGYQKDENTKKEEKIIFISMSIFIAIAVNIVILLIATDIKRENTEYEYAQILESTYYQQLPASSQKIVDNGILEDIRENKLNNEFKTTISLFKLKKILREVDSEAYLIKRKEQEQETLNKLKSLR